jgi:tetratricopeptide (TPR) repeat protein
MTAVLDEKERNIVPRWRDFSTTVELQELSHAVSVRPLLTEPGGQSAEIQQSAFIENRNISFAGDLISAALVSRNSAVAKDAAEFILQEGVEVSGGALFALAKRILSDAALPTFDLTETPANEGQKNNASRISDIRHSLRKIPNDAIQWMDLAFLFAINGKNPKAERAVKVALSLAPTNRFILRSSARFFLHLKNFQEAHKILRRSPNLRSDPWITAAEISVATAAEFPPFSVKEGRELMSAGNFSSHDLSELASALGTLEFHGGAIGKARKWVKNSLRAPNENSLAQAKWISRTITGVPMDVNVTDYLVPRPYEATALEKFVAGNWSGAYQCALSWFDDQPFSARSSQFASYIVGSLMEDHWASEKIIKRAMVSSPDDFGLNSTLAFDYASTGRLEEAKVQLAKAKLLQGPEWANAMISGNYGLVAYQEGDIAAGRFFYTEAVLAAEKLSDKRTLVSALSFFSRAEMDHDIDAAEKLLQRAEEVAKNVAGADLVRLLDLAKEKLKRINRKNSQIAFEL